MNHQSSQSSCQYDEDSVNAQKDRFRDCPAEQNAFFLYCVTCGSYFPDQEVESVAVEGQILNHWTARDVATVMGHLSGISPYGPLHLASAFYPSISFIMNWQSSEESSFLSSVGCSGKLVEPRKEVTGTSDL